jgi:DNA-directed RNA polymerase subunit M/transcription elongation factor TFIIS
MKFCPDCGNMLYAVAESAEGAFFQCRKCVYKEAITQANPLVYEHSLKEDTTAKLVMNPYLKFDPTLPRFTTIVCPNAECPSKRGATPDVVGVKLDATNVIWMYQCALCDTTWKQGARGP